MASDSGAADSGIFELAPEEAPKPVERFRPPSQVREEAKPLPCPQCRYDLRGLRSDVCPECGLKLTYGARRKAEDLRAGVKEHSWVDRKAVVLALIGLAVSAAVMWSQFEAVGLVVFAIDFAATLVIGWVVFLVCSMLWIGFDQHLRTTMVQTIGAFGFYAGVMALLRLMPVPGLIVWLIGAAVLTHLLSDLLEIELQDAAIIAVVTGILRGVLWAAVLLSMVD